MWLHSHDNFRCYEALEYQKAKVEEGTSEPPLRSELRKRSKIIRDIKRHLEEMRRKSKGMKSKRKRNGLNNVQLVYFVDTGGQPQFQEVLPNFIKCDINLLVHIVLNLIMSLTGKSLQFLRK